MTRAERAADKVRKEKEKAAALERLHKARAAAQQDETRKAEAALRAALRKADHKRRYHVGALAQEAGLFAWSNADFREVFAVLARLGNVPNPGGVLEGVLGEDLGELSEVSGYLQADTPISAFDSGKGTDVATEEAPKVSSNGSRKEIPSSAPRDFR